MLNSFNHRQHSQGFLGQFPWDIFGQVTLLFWQFCISFGPGLVYSFKMSGCNISNMRLSVSSPDETPRRELKIWCAVEYFRWTSRCVIWWLNTVSNAWYYFSNKLILEGEIKDAKMSSFSSDFQTLIKH